MINFKWWLVPWAVGFGPRPGAWPKRVLPSQLPQQPLTIQPQSSLPTWAWRVWWARRASNPSPWSSLPLGKSTGPRPTAFRGRPKSCDFFLFLEKTRFCVINCQFIFWHFIASERFGCFKRPIGWVWFSFDKLNYSEMENPILTLNYLIQTIKVNEWSIELC